MNEEPADRVSRRRYQREQMARQEAEALLEKKSRELFLANEKLSAHSTQLEQRVSERTAELQTALERAEAASTARSRFVATMSHEIRTPLGGMLGMIDLLSMDETDPAKKELLNYAKTAGVGLSRIVNDVLDFSKMEAGVFVFEEESVDIRALVESVRILAGSNDKGANRQIIAKIDASVPKLFLGDATRIRQLISNLISNALRYSTEGPIIIRAQATPHPKDALLRVEVEDFGVGIPEDKLSDLFKDFSQVSNALTAAAQGTGLGLAICKRIIEGVGGKIGVQSIPGVGSTFWIELPVEVVALPASNQNKTGSLEDSDSLESLVGKRVLIAEDNIINQKLLLTYANRMQLNAELAENGRIALEMFSPDKHDLVLMDVAMPEMDGLEATRRIRQKWSDRELPPILALTAHVMDAIEEEATLVGIDTVLSKPIPFDELKLALETALSRKPRKVETAAAPAETPSEDAPASGDEAPLLKLMSPGAVDELLQMFTVEDLSDLVRKFVLDSSLRIDRITAAIDEGDEDAMSKEAHSLKGSSLVLGFTEISEWARQIEDGKPSPDSGSMGETANRIRSKLQDMHALL